MDEPRPDVTFWMSRDSDPNGTLSDQIDIWTERPDRENMPGGGAMWIGVGDLGIERRVGVWSIGFALAQVHVVPDTDRELIRVGEETPAPRGS